MGNSMQHSSKQQNHTGTTSPKADIFFNTTDRLSIANHCQRTHT